MTSRDPHHQAEIGVDILPFELGFLPPRFEKKAALEMDDVPETRKRCIQELRDMIKRADYTISSIDFDEDFLLQHLRTRKFDVARSFEALKSFVALTKKNPAMFSNFSFDTSVKAIRSCIFTFLPWRCHEGCAIVYLQIGKWDPAAFPLEELKRFLAVFLMSSARDPMTQVCGIKAIIDASSQDLSYLKQLSPATLYLLYHGTQHCVPGRYKGIHVVNHNLFFKSVWLCIKQFMSQKLQDRIHFHSSTKKLFDHFPRTVIPEKYGGDLVVPDQSEWLRKMMSPERLAMIGGGALA